MHLPDISVVVPARNEGNRIAATIDSIARSRTTGARVEIIVVDDASTDGSIPRLVEAMPRLLQHAKVDVKLCRQDERVGIYRARNVGAWLASAPILFQTDAHVAFCDGWDRLVFRHLEPNRVLAGTVVHEQSSFQGYGCRLAVPFMGTQWNPDPGTETTPVQVAAGVATVMTRELFERLGGYDEGMLFYGAGEPELSLRAWLQGAEIVNVRDLRIRHRFRLRDALGSFIATVRPYSVHNCLRFGLLYLSELGCLQLLRHHLQLFPNIFARALSMLAASDVWERRTRLEAVRERTFDWFVKHFGLTNPIGEQIL